MAFTLIELLVVIAIICIIAAILFPVFAKAREKARQSACASNLKQISSAMLQYVQDYDEALPAAAFFISNGNCITFPQYLMPYTKSINIYQCPSNPHNATVMSYQTSTITPHNFPASYSANGCGNFGGSSPFGCDNNNTPAIITLGKIDSVAQTICFVDSTSLTPETTAFVAVTGFSGHTTKLNFAFADGHVKAMRPGDTILPVDMWSYKAGTIPDTTQIKNCTDADAWLSN